MGCPQDAPATVEESASIAGRLVVSRCLLPGPSDRAPSNFIKKMQWSDMYRSLETWSISNGVNYLP